MCACVQGAHGLCNKCTTLPKPQLKCFSVGFISETILYMYIVTLHNCGLVVLCVTKLGECCITILCLKIPSACNLTKPPEVV